MRKIFTSLCLTAMIMVSSVANAQDYSAKITSDPEDKYFSGSVTFDPTEVATKLGTDTASLHKLISDGGNVYLKTESGTSNSYTGNANEFWMNISGVAQGYSADGTCWFAGLYYNDKTTDAETNEVTEANISVNVGQMPNYFKKIYEDSDLNCTLLLKNGATEVSFAVNLHVNAAEKPKEIAAPTKLFAELEVLKEYAATLEFTEGKEYEGKTVSVDMSDIETVLGVDTTTIQGNLETILVTRQVVSVLDGTSYLLGDTVKAISEFNTDGWFGRYSEYDEATGNSTLLPQNAPHAHGADATFYLQSFKLSDYKLTATYGQYKNTMKAGDTDCVEVFIVNGKKAVKVKFTANVEAQKVYDFTEMTKVGSVDVEITADIDDNYATKSFTVDMAAVIEALGCTADDISDVYAFSAENEVSDNHTEGSGGYYFNEDGYIGDWGGSATFFVALGSLADGKYSIGQRSGKYTDIKENANVKTWLLFMYNDKYYVVNVSYTIKAPVEGEEVYGPKNLIATETISMQIKLSDSEWNYGTKTVLDLEKIKSQIGTEDFVLYTDKATTDETTSVTTLEFSKNYTCTPAPGFWYGTTTYENSEGQVVVDNAGWGTNSFGITYASGEITWYQYPGQRAAGDNYLADLYLVNSATGDYLKYNLYVEFVNEIIEYKNAGEEIAAFDMDNMTSGSNLEMSVSSEELNKIITSLGAADVTAFKESGKVLALKSVSSYQEIGYDNATYFDSYGYVVGEEDASAIVNLEVSLDDDVLTFYADYAGATEEIPVGAKAIIIFEYDSSIYTYTIRFTDSTDAIAGVENADATSKAIFNVAGAKTSSLQKGINIVKMSDGSVKKIMK
ncbi:MAG: DUF4859 domain-containing protein [Bacteroidaceae bacterium]|nr:DUF4859 domain-containing protein [Bacteroidaceae bacterium]